MGLDITAVSQARYVGPVTDDYRDNQERAYPVSSFAERADGMAEGLYEYGAKQRFRAGSYSWYNQFRRALCEAALGTTDEVVWASRGSSAFAGQPFVEMIDFSDCEGMIGPKTCAKLAADFETGRATVRAKLLAEFQDLYDRFAAAFTLAADGGFVMFH